MEKIIVEVGSTVTKVDKFDGLDVKRITTKTIEFKNNYKKDNKLNNNDVNMLIDLIKELQKEYDNIYVCGTSIFRGLKDCEREEFLSLFSSQTGLNFEIISQEKENELTVKGAVKNVPFKVAVFVGGGGSTEIAIYDNGIKEMVNSDFGVVDITNLFSDLKDDLASTDLEDVKKVIKEKLNLPKQKANTLILAGGAHLYFALTSGINYSKNNLFESGLHPIVMDLESREKDTRKFYEEISLDKIRDRVEDPAWWSATRAMCAFVLVIAEELDVKYIIPTDISMTYGII